MDITLKGKINEKHYVFLVDTGSMITLIKGGIISNVGTNSSMRAYGITGEDLHITGRAIKEVIVAGEIFELKFHVCEGMDIPYDGVFGLDSLRTMGVVIDLSVDEIRLASLQDKTTLANVSSVVCESKGNEGVANPQTPCERVDEYMSSNLIEVDECVPTWRVVVGETLVIGPRVEMMLYGVLKADKGLRKADWPQEVYVEDKPWNSEREVCVARVVSKVFVAGSQGEKMAEVQCRVLNVGNCAVTLVAGDELGVASDVGSGTPRYRGMGRPRGKRSEADSVDEVSREGAKPPFPNGAEFYEGSDQGITSGNG